MSQPADTPMDHDMRMGSPKIVPRKLLVYTPPVTPLYHYFFNNGDNYTVSTQNYIYNNSVSTVGAGMAENNQNTIQTSTYKTGYTGASSSKTSVLVGGTNNMTFTYTTFSICF